MLLEAVLQNMFLLVSKAKRCDRPFENASTFLRPSKKGAKHDMRRTVRKKLFLSKTSHKKWVNYLLRIVQKNIVIFANLLHSP